MVQRFQIVDLVRARFDLHHFLSPSTLPQAFSFSFPCERGGVHKFNTLKGRYQKDDKVLGRRVWSSTGSASPSLRIPHSATPTFPVFTEP